jgi:ParB-like chromosome segregation protein Spo0J
MTDATRYQVLRPLTAEEYDRLKADIRARGVQVPIEYDEEGNVLDGHHRLQACEELGIRDWPRVTRAGLTEEQKWKHVVALNDARRQMTRKDRKEMAEEILRRDPERSDRKIAGEVGMSPTSVGKVRGDLVESGQLSKLDSCTGKDGRTRRRKSSAPRQLSKREQEQMARDKIVLDNWEKSDKELAVMCGLCPKSMGHVRNRLIAKGRAPVSRSELAPKIAPEVRELAEVDTGNVGFCEVNGRIWVPRQPQMAADSLLFGYYSGSSDRLAFMRSAVARLSPKELAEVIEFAVRMRDDRAIKGPERTSSNHGPTSPVEVGHPVRLTVYSPSSPAGESELSA